MVNLMCYCCPTPCCPHCAERHARPKYTYKRDGEDVSVCFPCWRKYLDGLLKDKTAAQIGTIAKQRRFGKVKELCVSNALMRYHGAGTWEYQPYVPLCEGGALTKWFYGDMIWRIRSDLALVFENDEGQHHRNHGCLKDIERMFAMTYAHAGMRLVFIRFNCDGYKTGLRDRAPGMFDRSEDEGYEKNKNFVPRMRKLERLVDRMQEGGVVSLSTDDGLVGAVYVNYDHDSSQVSEMQTRLGARNVASVSL